jgi:hypothetical protein
VVAGMKLITIVGSGLAQNFRSDRFKILGALGITLIENAQKGTDLVNVAVFIRMPEKCPNPEGAKNVIMKVINSVFGEGFIINRAEV